MAQPDQLYKVSSGVPSSRLLVVHLLSKDGHGVLSLYLINGKIIPANIAVVTNNLLSIIITNKYCMNCEALLFSV